MSRTTTRWWELSLPFLARLVLFLGIVAIVAQCGCSTFHEQTYPLPGHPGWVVQESAVPVRGIPDEPPGVCDRVWEGQQKFGPVPPCGFTDATTVCSTKTVKLWWYARPGALDHELMHVKECK